MQEILQEDKRPKVKRRADENKDDCQPVWWSYKDLWEFHCGDVWLVGFSGSIQER